MPNYLPIAEERKDGFIPFLNTQGLVERFWTDSISDDDNHYAKSAYKAGRQRKHEVKGMNNSNFAANIMSHS